MFSVTATQIFFHLVGDYILQSDWMAKNKTTNSFACGLHVLFYSVPFWFFFSPSLAAIGVISISHFLIDRFRLARYVVFVKNYIGVNKPWSECQATGYPPETPVFMSVWLLIIADNIIHIAINAFALGYL